MSIATTVAVALLCVLAYAITLRNLSAEIDRSLAREASAYSAAVRSAPASEALVTATRQYMAGRSGGQANLSPVLLLRLQNGNTFSNSDIRLDRAPGNTALRSNARSADFFHVALDGMVYRTLAVPVNSTDGTRLGTFEVALSEGTPRAVAASVAGALGAAGFLVVLIGSVLSIWAARGALSPLTKMAADAAAISLASPGRRINIEGPNDELSALADSLNAMLVRLERAYADQRRFVADASHELRTPVAIIRGNVELLRTGKLAGQDALESFEMIDSESVRMTRLLDELLSLARLEGGIHVFQPLEVRTILEEGSARAQTLGERVITVKCPPNIWVSGDPDLLDQAVLIMVRNAFAHTQDGGSIALACDADARFVRFTVSDDGPGIPEAELDRIFDRFYRVQGRRTGQTGGAGLGLAIAQRLVTLHGGTMRAENVEGSGARFTIELPRIPEPKELSRH